MKTYKEQALELIMLYRDKEWTNGCHLVKNHRGYIVVNDRAFDGKIGLLDKEKNYYFEVSRNVKGFMTIGHPPALATWLRLLGTVGYFCVTTAGELRPIHLQVAASDELGYWLDQKIYFDLKTGQPATDDDYRKIVEIMSK